MNSIAAFSASDKTAALRVANKINEMSKRGEITGLEGGQPFYEPNTDRVASVCQNGSICILVRSKSSSRLNTLYFKLGETISVR